MSNLAPDSLPGQPRPLSTSEIQRMVAEGRLLRILRPDLKETIRQAVAAASGSGQLAEQVVDHDGEIYLSFQCIEDAGRREEAYRLVQQWQAGGVINTAYLPAPFGPLLEPAQAQRNRLAAAFVLCIVAGVASGVIAMAISVLVTTVLDTPAGHFAGMDVTAVVFVLFSVLGWFSSALLLWARFRSPVARVTTQRESTYS